MDEISAMTGKRDIKVLTEILDLSDVKVISHRLHTGIGMILQIEQEKLFATCPKNPLPPSLIQTNWGADCH
ncbi:MAG: hypothetical protein WCO29_24200, partial [Nostocales cyanobacterium ELA583]